MTTTTHVALLHHPVLDKGGAVITTAVTNLDIHDIARASRTFGVARYHVVTPIEAQRQLVAQIVGHWTEGSGREHNDKRTEAVERVRISPSLDEVIEHLGGHPYVVVTGAKPRENTIKFSQLQVPPGRQLLLVFGTGWGLAPEVFTRADAVLEPIRGAGEYNHLSVRSAVAIVLDRLFGNRD